MNRKPSQWRAIEADTVSVVLRAPLRLLTDTLNPAKFLPPIGRGRGKGLDNLVDNIGPEAGDIVRKAGREVRLDLVNSCSNQRRRLDFIKDRGTKAYIGDDLYYASRADMLFPTKKKVTVGAGAGEGEGEGGRTRARAREV